MNMNLFLKPYRNLPRMSFRITEDIPKAIMIIYSFNVSDKFWDSGVQLSLIANLLYSGSSDYRIFLVIL